MTNRDMIKNYNGLASLQGAESTYLRRTGKQLLGGRIKVTYAVRKNMHELLAKLKPYDDARDCLTSEYRDTEKEKAVFEEKLRQYDEKVKKGKDVARPQEEAIWREGKTEEEYRKKLDELLDIDVEDVNVHKIDVDQLDGLDLSSSDLGVFDFMLKDE